MSENNPDDETGASSLENYADSYEEVTSQLQGYDQEIKRFGNALADLENDKTLQQFSRGFLGLVVAGVAIVTVGGAFSIIPNEAVDSILAMEYLNSTMQSAVSLLFVGLTSLSVATVLPGSFIRSVTGIFVSTLRGKNGGEK